MTIVTNPCATDRQDEWPSYDSEQASDVTLVVGGGGGAAGGAGSGGPPWRFPLHRCVLARAGGPLAALALNPDKVLYLSDVDKNAFDQVMRFVYGVPLQLSSATVARSTLDAAHKFKLPTLLDAAADALQNLLGPEALLVIVRDLRMYCGSEALAATAPAPSAPPLSAIKRGDDQPAHAGEQASEARMALACARLLRAALEAVDEYAERVLADEGFSELSYGDASLIAQRPGLCLSSETVLALALRSWAGAAVRRAGRGDIPQHRRAALGELCYAPRYLLLSEKEFLQEVAPLEILDPAETALVLAALCGRPLLDCSPGQRELLQRLSEQRLNSKAKVPPANTDTNNNPKRSKKKRKNSKKEDGKEEDGCCQCFGEGLLRTLLCLFD